MLELRDVCYEVDGGKEILKNVSLKIDDRFVAITGPNGGGKSTLAKIIVGIDTPTSGQILLDGEDVTRLSITERARQGMSYAFQQPVRFKGLRVRDLLTLAAGKDTRWPTRAASSPRWGCARTTISTASSTTACPAANSSASRLRWCWRAVRS